MQSRGPTLVAGILIGLAMGVAIHRSGRETGRGDAERERGDARPVALAAFGRKGDRASQDAIVDAVHKLAPSVVFIEVIQKPSARDPDSVLPPQIFPDEGARPEGSGIIIDGRAGYVVTNNHVVEGAERIRVVLRDRREFEGHIVGTDRVSDVALLKIPGGDLPEAVLGSSQDHPDGSWAIAIGNPMSFQNSVTVGVVSAHDRELRSPDGVYLDSLLQTDAAINPGNSGGALCDIDGNVIGMNTAIIPTAQGLGFAVSVETLKFVVDSLLTKGRVIRAWMGVRFETLDAEIAARSHVKFVPGVIVHWAASGQPAEQAGLRTGDIIVAVAGSAVTTAEQIRNQIRKRKPGESVEILASRGGRLFHFEVRLAEMPEAPPSRR